MRSVLRCAVAGFAVILAGCSSGEGAHVSSTAASPSIPPAATQTSAAAAPPSQSIGVTPGGVTTKVDVPAESTEEQYGQACLHTKAWMDSEGGDKRALVEPFLRKIQSSLEASPSTFNSTWTQLTHAQQAAVIIAVEAAADGGC